MRLSRKYARGLPLVLCLAIAGVFLLLRPHTPPSLTSAALAEAPAEGSVPAAGSMGGVVGTNEAAPSTVFGNWVFHCVDLKQVDATGKTASDRVPLRSCEVIQTVQVKGEKNPIAQVAFGYLPSQERGLSKMGPLQVTAVLPANVSLPGEVGLFAGTESGDLSRWGLVLAWSKCFNGGCYAAAPVDTTKIRSLVIGPAGQLRFQDAQKRVVGIPVSWEGLSPALAALRAEVN